MTDRDFLERLEEDLATQLATPPQTVDLPEFDLALRLPEEGYMGTPQGFFAGWVHWLPIFEGQAPVVTGREFSKDHPARDFAYLNWLGMPESEPQVFGGTDGTRYLVPTGKVVVVAPGPGFLWQSGFDHWGWHCRIDHGKYVGFPLNSYVTHMEKLFVPEVTHQKGVQGPFVYAGQPLGICGAGSTHANHVHGELIDYSQPAKWGRGGTPLDPKLYVPHWGRVIQQRLP